MPATEARNGRKGKGVGSATGARSDYFLDFKILNCATGEPGKVQVRDLVRVVGIVAPFDPRGSVLGKILFYRGPGGKWD